MKSCFQVGNKLNILLFLLTGTRRPGCEKHILPAFNGYLLKVL
jgi:hypothetical protein